MPWVIIIKSPRPWACPGSQGRDTDTGSVSGLVTLRGRRERLGTAYTSSLASTKNLQGSFYVCVQNSNSLFSSSSGPISSPPLPHLPLLILLSKERPSFTTTNGGHYPLQIKTYSCCWCPGTGSWHIIPQRLRWGHQKPRARARQPNSKLFWDMQAPRALWPTFLS